MKEISDQTKESLKEFILLVNDGKEANLKERLQILHDILVLSAANHDVYLTLLKVSLRPLITAYLLKYQSSQARKLVKLFLLGILGSTPVAVHYKLVEETCNVICETVDNVLNKYTTPASDSIGISRVGLLAIKVVVGCIVDRKFDATKLNIKHLVNALVASACLICAAGRARDTHRLAKLFGVLFNKHESLVEAVVFDCVGDACTENHLVLVGLVFAYSKTHNKTAVVDVHVTKAVDNFVKIVLAAKICPRKFILQGCGPIIGRLNHDSFKELVLPSIKKYALRNTENVVPALSTMFDNLVISLDSYAMELMKLLTPVVHAKNEEMSDFAVEAIEMLAKQCSNVETVKQLVKHIFAVFNGSEGKLTTATQRINVVKAVGALANHTISGNQPNYQVAEQAILGLVNTLKDQGHEPSVACSCAQLSLWIQKCHQKLPQQLTAWFIEGLTSKKMSPAVKFEYLRCISNSYHANVLESGRELIPALLTKVETAAKTGNQTAVAMEGMASGLILLKLARIDPEMEEKLTKHKFWTALLQDKIFTNDRILMDLNANGMKTLCELLQRVLCEFSDHLPDRAFPSHICRAIILALVWPAKQPRIVAKTTVKRLLGLLGGHQFSEAMFDEFNSVLQQNWLQNAYGQISKDKLWSGGEADRDIVCLGRKTIVDGCLSLCQNVGWDAQQTVVVLCAALKCSAIPLILNFDSWLWIKLMVNLGLAPYEFCEKNSAAICETIESIQDYEMQANATGLLSKIDGDLVWKDLLIPRLGALPVAQLLQCSLDDVHVLNTPEGILYDTSVIQTSNNAEETNLANMKRESKAYSYKDQLADAQIRKELEEKKRKEGKIEPVKLTNKQKEAMHAKLSQEKIVREHMKQLQKEVLPIIATVSAVTKFNPASAEKYIMYGIEKMCPMIASPLVFESLSEWWLLLAKAVLHAFSQSTVSLFTNCSLRLMGSPGVLSQWTQEPLTTQALRVIQLLNEKMEVPIHEDNEFEQQVMTCNLFALCYPMVKSLIVDEDDIAAKDTLDDIRIHGIKFIELHCTKDGLQADDLTKLPCAGVIDALLKVIVLCQPGPVQQRASAACIRICTAVNEIKHKPIDAIESVVKRLLTALLVVQANVREVALKCLDALSDSIKLAKINDNFMQRIWVARFDENDDNSTLATRLAQIFDCRLSDTDVMNILDDVTSPNACTRNAAAPALAAALQEKPKLVSNVLQRLEKEYDSLDKNPMPILDTVGRVIQEAVDKTWTARCGIALSLRHLCPLVPSKEVAHLFSILVPNGVSDPHEVVQNAMLQAAIATVKQHGETHVSTLHPLLEKELAHAPDNVDYDTVRQSLVVILGSLAKHMNPQDPKIKPIVARLIETLSTPSQQVQEAVSQCLPPLVPAIKEQSAELAAQLLHLLLEANNYGERRGAAYGLAGLVKGLGIVALRQLDIMPSVQQALDNKKKPQHREGALLALEMLCRMLGKLFEPYVVSILPSLLLALGDNDMHVRDAAEECSKVIMSNLSGHGVKLVLPALLAALKEDSWRTKAGSVELLGAMAYCAPKQLSSCLPSIVPKLIEVLSDTHHKVQKAGIQALNNIGLVIRNPEVQALAHLLLAAIEDPSTKTAICLSTLLRTQFVHYIDAPSLALIMPVVQRAFDDRSTDTRKLAAQIIGNIYALTDQKDVEPYLDQLLPGLKKCILDPNPEVRARAASALGAMLRSASGDMGEELQQDLIPWLKERLVANTSSVDRSGAAQGLSEVLGGLGRDHLERVLPDVIKTAESDSVEPHVRDGYILMFIYLPSVFGQDLVPHLTKIIPALLKSLAVEEEFVRDSALKAGQRLISHYCDNAIELLLPSLQAGLFDNNWRIRYASVTLLGEFLFRITGVTGKMTTDGGDDDAFGSESSNKVISRVLGTDRRLNVLAGLYMARSDVALQVRLSAGHVWKVIVSNTGRTLKEILPTLFHLLLGSLATSSSERQTIAARCLGELVKKMGERVLVDVVPVLEVGLTSEDANQREGVCIALSEIIQSTTRDMVMMYSENLVPTVKTALCDPLEHVRMAAAESFNRLHGAVGPQSLDEVLLPMLNMLDDKEVGEYALDGLQKVMAMKSKVVLPYLIPKLIEPPINTVALSQLTSVAGDALIRHLHKVCHALLLSVTTSHSEQDTTLAHSLCLEVLLSVKEEEGVSIIIDFLTHAALNGEKDEQTAAIHILHDYCHNTTVSLKPKVDHLINNVLTLYASTNPTILQWAIGALAAVIKTLDPREQLEHVNSMRAAVKSVLVKYTQPPNDKLLPGFCESKGLGTVLPVIREGVLNGAADVKEHCAQCLGDVINASSDAALKVHVVNVTGPLIRVLGDRYQPSVKIAILHTLALFLAKVSVMLKPFLPQLQSTFLKALQETSSRGVRLNAARALAQLVYIHPKPDVMLLELLKSIKSTQEETAVLETNLIAIRGLLVAVGAKVSSELVAQLHLALKQLITNDEDNVRVAAAAAFAACVINTNCDTKQALQAIVDSSSDDWKHVHGNVMVLQFALSLDPKKVKKNAGSKIVATLQSAITSDRAAVACCGLRAAGLLLKYDKANATTDLSLLTSVCRAVNSQLIEAKLLCALVVSHLASHPKQPLDYPHLKIIVPSMINGIKEKNSAVRNACEQALVETLAVREGEQQIKTYKSESDPGAQMAIQDALDILKKAAGKTQTPLDSLDDTERVREEDPSSTFSTNEHANENLEQSAPLLLYREIQKPNKKGGTRAVVSVASRRRHSRNNHQMDNDTLIKSEDADEGSDLESNVSRLCQYLNAEDPLPRRATRPHSYFGDSVGSIVESTPTSSGEENCSIMADQTSNLVYKRTDKPTLPKDFLSSIPPPSHPPSSSPHVSPTLDRPLPPQRQLPALPSTNLHEQESHYDEAKPPITAPRPSKMTSPVPTTEGYELSASRMALLNNSGITNPVTPEHLNHQRVAVNDWDFQTTILEKNPETGSFYIPSGSGHTTMSSLSPQSRNLGMNQSDPRNYTQLASELTTVPVSVMGLRPDVTGSSHSVAFLKRNGTSLGSAIPSKQPSRTSRHNPDSKSSLCKSRSCCLCVSALLVLALAIICYLLVTIFSSGVVESQVSYYSGATVYGERPSDPIVSLRPLPISFDLGDPFVADLAPGIVSYSSFNLQRDSHVQFNLSVQSDARLVIYGEQTLKPTPSRHAFHKIILGNSLHMRDSRGKRYVDENLLTTSFVEYLTSGKWYLGFLNDDSDKQTVKLTAYTLHEHGVNQGCRYDCYGKGECRDNTCICQPGYSGDYCQQTTCPVLCSGNGILSGGRCHCHQGFKGPDCDIPAHLCLVPHCNHHGSCDPQGSCACDIGWSGEFCHHRSCADEHCSGHGVCHSGVCYCEFGWKGEKCDETFTSEELCPNGSGEDSLRCSAHGTWNSMTSLCECQPEYTGEFCDQDNCVSPCTNGVCVAGICECNIGWTGRTCTDVDCLPGCTEHGQCHNGTCICHKGWHGENCLLDGCPNMCSGRGECRKYSVYGIEKYRCECSSDATGEACAIHRELSCDDGIDNDNDTLVDCSDSDCCISANCASSNLCQTVPDPYQVLVTGQTIAAQASFFVKTRFLLQPGSVQQYPDMKLFQHSRVSVIRGRIVTLNGDSLTGVRVTDASHPLFGFTISRGGGLFDLMVNGGGAVTLQLMRQPIGTVRRTVRVPWNSIIYVGDILMSKDNQEATPKPSEGCISARSLHKLTPFLIPSWKLSRYVGSLPAETSVIGDSRAVYHTLPIYGTQGLYLTYHSAQAEGYKSGLWMSLIGEHLPQKLRRVKVKIEIEGVNFETTLEAKHNLTYEYSWDKKNVYKQKVFGLTPAYVSIGYIYKDCNEIIFERNIVKLNGFKSGSATVANWNLNIHHHLDVLAGVVEKGDGSTIYMSEGTGLLTTTVGKWGGSSSWQRPLVCATCNGDVNRASLYHPIALASSRDSSLYIGDFDLIRKVSNNNSITTVLQLSPADTTPSHLYHLTTHPISGELYVSLPLRRQIWMVKYEHESYSHRTVAGDGMPCRVEYDLQNCGEGGPAPMAKITYPKGMAFDSLGILYILDERRVVSVDCEGILRTIIGGSRDLSSPWTPSECQLEYSLDALNLFWPTHIAVDSLTQNLYILDSNVIYRIDLQSKRVRRVLGSPENCPPEQQRSDRLESAKSMTIDHSGRVYVVESDGKRLHRVRAFVSKGGKLVAVPDLVIGAMSKCDCDRTNCPCDEKEATLAREAHLHNPSDIAVDQAGVIYIADTANYKVKSVVPETPKWSQPNRQYSMVDADSQLQYYFNRFGQHQATLDIITNTFLYNFTYHIDTSFGKLIHLTDSGGHRLYFLRPGSDKVVIETAQNHKSTALISNLHGEQLDSLIAPDRSVTRFTYDTSVGLMTSRIDADARTWQYKYDYTGYIYEWIGPAGSVNQIRPEITSNAVRTFVFRGGELISTLQSSEHQFFTTGIAERNVLSLANGRTVQVEMQDGTELQWDAITTSLLQQHQTAVLRNKITLPSESDTIADGMTSKLEWRYYLRRDGSSKAHKRVILVGRKTRVNGVNILTIEYDRNTNQDKIMDQSNVALITVQYNPAGEITWILPVAGSDLAAYNASYDSVGRLKSHAWGLTNTVFKYDDYSRLTAIATGRRETVFEYESEHNIWPSSVAIASGGIFKWSWDDQGRLSRMQTPQGLQYSFESVMEHGYILSLYTLPHLSEDNVPVIVGRGEDNSVNLVVLPDGYRKMSRHKSSDGLETVMNDGWKTLIHSANHKSLFPDSVTSSSCNNDIWSLSVVKTGPLVSQIWENRHPAASVACSLHVRLSYDDTMRLTSLQASINSDKTLEPMSMVYDRDSGIMTKYNDYSIQYSGAKTRILNDQAVIEIVSNERRIITSIKLSLRGRKCGEVGIEYNSWGELISLSSIVLGEVQPKVTVKHNDDGKIMMYKIDEHIFNMKYNKDGMIIYMNDKQIVRESGVVKSFASLKYSNDISGFVMQRGLEYFQYDSFGRLILAQQQGVYNTQFVYDHRHRVITIIQSDGIAEQLFYVNPGKPYLVTYSVKGDSVTIYHYTANDKLFSVQRDSTTFYVLTANDGTPLFVFSGDGGLTKSMVRGPFGQVIRDSNNDLRLLIGFRGFIQDPNSGIVIMDGRPMDTLIGQFLSYRASDWTRPNPVQPQFVHAFTVPELQSDAWMRIPSTNQWLQYVGVELSASVPLLKLPSTLCQSKSALIGFECHLDSKHNHMRELLTVQPSGLVKSPVNYMSHASQSQLTVHLSPISSIYGGLASVLSNYSNLAVLNLGDPDIQRLNVEEGIILLLNESLILPTVSLGSVKSDAPQSPSKIMTHYFCKSGSPEEELGELGVESVTEGEIVQLSPSLNMTLRSENEIQYLYIWARRTALAVIYADDCNRANRFALALDSQSVTKDWKSGSGLDIEWIGPGPLCPQGR